MTETVHSPSIKGNISDAVHPAKLLTGFLKAKKSGVLRFRDGITVADVALAHGSVVYDRALAVRSRGFGNYLTDKDKIRPRQLRRLIALAGSQDRTLPEQLVADGVITPDELDAVLEQYYWDAADGVFGWRRGTYAFEEKDLAEDAGAAARDATLAFIVRGVAEHYDPLAIARRLQKRMHHALRVNADNDPPADALRGLPEAAAMLDAAAGGATLKEATGVSADDKALGMATAFALLTLGVLKFAVPEDKRREVAEVRRVRTSRDPLQKLFAAAMTSVDRIHERVARETREEIEVPIAPAGAEPRTTEQIENAERELQEKLDRLLELKRQRRTIIEEHAHGESAGPATETMEEAPPDAPTIMDDGFAATLSHDTPEQDAAFDGGEDEDHRSFSFETEFDDDLRQDGNFEEVNPDDYNDAGLGDYQLADGELPNFSPSMSNEDVISMMKTSLEESDWRTAEAAYNELQSRGYQGADVVALAGWARYHLDQADPFAAGAELVQQAIEKNPKLDIPYLTMGRIYLAEGDKGMAELYLVRAIEMNADCFEAKELIKEIYRNR